MKFLLITAAALCVGSANAALVNSVSAGAFTFENIQCSNVYGDCGPLTASAALSGSGSTLTIADNGSFRTPDTVVQISYDVVYTGSAQIEYTWNSTGTWFFLGNLPNNFILLDKNLNGTVIGGFEGLLPTPPQSVFDQNKPFSTFHVFDDIFLGAPAVNGGSPGSFSTSYAAVSAAPEPASLALIFLSSLSLVLFRAAAIFERFRRRRNY